MASTVMVVVIVTLVLLCATPYSNCQIHRRSKILSRHTSFIQLQTKAHMPNTCESLATQHGKQQVEMWLAQAYKPNASISEMCQSAIDCKRVLYPLLSHSGTFRTKCPNDCSHNGICRSGGRCECRQGFGGTDCSKVLCTNNCSNRGDCLGGSCQCFPGFRGTYCQDEVTCPSRGNRTCNGNGVCYRGKCFCNPGFTSEDCSKVASCPRDCSNRGLCVYGRCFCRNGFGGKACEKSILSSAKCPSNCGGCGRCQHGSCFCDKGFFGPDCSNENPCPMGGNGLPCSARGTCQAGQCECNSGYGGFTCSLKTQCPGNGTCSGNGWCAKGVCFCRAGWTGSDCSKPLPCPNACSKQGYCGDGRCICYAGFSGKDCSVMAPGVTRPPADPTVGPNGKKLQFTQAMLRTALNRGEKCINGCSGTGVCFNGTCACIPGFGGRDCSVLLGSSQCPNHCSFRGVCLFGTCRCVSGYSGVDCSTVDGKDEKASLQLLKQCPGSCSGHGTCQKKAGGVRACECDEGYGGPDCATPVPCPNNCKGRGLCRRGKCFCFPGFSGPQCGQIARCKNGCSGHGQCFLGRCFCQAFYTGDDCSKTPHCPRTCGQHGICRGNNICACEAGWGGVTCDEKLKCDHDCSGPTHGHCIATVNGTSCVCNEKYTGKFCELDVMKCKHDCKHGVCLNGKCACNTGYSGEACDVRTNVGQSVMSTVADAIKRAQQTNQSALRFKETNGITKKTLAMKALAQKARFQQASDGSCPNNCNKQGVCANGQCFCNPGHSGIDCGVKMTCPNDCSNNGICKYGQCWCGPNHVGDDCSLYTTAGRKFPPVMVTAIIASLTFFVGIVVGRKTLARSGLKFAQSLSEPELRHPIS